MKLRYDTLLCCMRVPYTTNVNKGETILETIQKQKEAKRTERGSNT